MTPPDLDIPVAPIFIHFAKPNEAEMKEKKKEVLQKLVSTPAIKIEVRNRIDSSPM